MDKIHSWPAAQADGFGTQKTAELELSDYLHILRHRKKIFVTTALALFVLSLAFTLHWSNYRSSATVEVEPPDISSSTATPLSMMTNDRNEALADLRISHLQQKVLSTGSLVEIITKFNLYAKKRTYTPIADVADDMRKKIHVDLVGSTLANPASAQNVSPGQLSAIAFTLSFDYGNPQQAQQVANELVSRFLDEDLKERRREAKETSDFLGSQIKVLEASMEDQEKKIADFRAKNEGAEPESLLFNRQAAESVMMNMQSLDAQITANQGTQGTLRAQLASVDPYSRVIADGQVLTTPSIQLKALKSQYATMTAQYGPDHPDVLKLRHQIQALQSHMGGGASASADTTQLRAQIADVTTNLAAAKKTYGPDHPDVQSLQHQLASLQAELETARTQDAGALKQDADNPAYLQIVAELKSTEEQYKALQEQKAALLAQQEKYEKAVASNPAATQKLAALSRDYENSQLRYRELKEKKMAADMSEEIQQDRSGQRLDVIDPPELPTHTHPARIIFLIGGIVFSLMGGAASVAAVQTMSQSVVGPRHLEALMGVAPLATVPHLVTQAEMNDVGHRRLRTAKIAFGCIAVAALIFSYTVMPLDVLWAVITHWLGFS